MPYLIDIDVAACTRNDMLGIQGANEYRFRGLDCPDCGTWVVAGHIYPTIAPDQIPDHIKPQSSSPMGLDQFKTIQKYFCNRFGPGYPFAPCTTIGLFKGDIKAWVNTDFAWSSYWDLFVSEKTRDFLKKHNAILRVSHADLRRNHIAVSNYLQVEVLPTAHLHPDILTSKPCSLCGRQPITRSKEGIILDESKYNAGIPLQRIREMPGVIVANSAFYELAAAYDLSGLMFKQVPLA